MSSGFVLPQLQALLNQAPAGSNPYAWWAAKLHEQNYPGVAPWSKPIFLLIAAIGFINIPITIYLLVSKYRKEGGLSVGKCREHVSGGRYLCLNAQNVFLVGHVLTSCLISTYCILHIYKYDKVGSAWHDLVWAVFIWLCPYLYLLFVSLGALYAILVAPSPLAYARRANADGQLTPHQPPLAKVPTWLLNGLIIAAPATVTIAVLIPGVRLLTAVKTSEEYATHIVGPEITKFAIAYAQNITPALTDQISFLKSLVMARDLTATASSRWSPCYGVWLVFVAIASILATVAFFAIYRVTKTRLNLAMRTTTSLDGESGNAEVDEMRRWEKSQTPSRNQQAAVKQARLEHYSLSIQFGAAAVLLWICDATLFADTIVGYKIHTERDALAVCLLVPFASYTVQSTVSVVLFLLRTVRGQADIQDGNASQSNIHTASRSGTGHFRSSSQVTGSSGGEKTFVGSDMSKDFTSSDIALTTLPKINFVSTPSVAQQIHVDQTVYVYEDTASMIEEEDVSRPQTTRSESILITPEVSEPPSPSPNAHIFGRAL